MNRDPLTGDAPEHAKTDLLRRLERELALVERVKAAERERIAKLAQLWGHNTFAQFLRTYKEDDHAELDQATDRRAER